MKPSNSTDGAVRLSHLGVIRAKGADALKFLHGQLTSDMLGLDASRARLAGFCSAKGRLQASFVVWRAAEDEVLLLCSTSVLPATLKRLSMFVLRSQCKLSDASNEVAVFGVAGGSASRLIGDVGAWTRHDSADATVIALPDAAGLRRCLWAGPSTTSPPDIAQPLALDTWRWLDIQSGLPIIEAATVDQFVPQMLNFELIGGVDFQKGCFPGQEIVARSQYRGTIKRRMFLFDIDSEATAGQEVFHSADAQQPAGMVVNAAPRPAAPGASALVEVKLACLDDGSLHLGRVDGPVLRGAPLPYAVALDPVTPA